MDEDARGATRGGHPHECVQVLLVAVHATVGYQSHQVHRATRRDRCVDRLDQNRVLEDRAVRDRTIDPGELLVDDATGTDVEVPDLGVAHLPLGQADREPAREKRGPRAPGEQRIKVGGMRKRDGVAGPGLGQAEPVHDDEDDGRARRHARVPP